LEAADSEGSVLDGPEPKSAANGATLDDLAEKLATLREHLAQVVAELNAPRECNSGLRRAARGNGQLRCHECGRTGSKDALGWTLRLCGDDVLHAFCPECDYQYFHRNGR
jgi:hypothetical protein